MDAQFQRQVGAVIAFAQVADTHDGDFSVVLNRGFASVAHVEGSGQYDLTLDSGMTGPNQDTADLVVQAQFGDPTINFAGFITRAWLDNHTLRLTVWNAGFADDGGFDVKVIRATNHE